MIFLDSSDIQEVIKWHQAGVIRGVTTNPTILKKDRASMNGDWTTTDRIIEICHVVYPYPVSVELEHQGDVLTMIVEADDKRRWAHNINIKIPIHGPEGESNLPVIKACQDKNIPINVTACMNAQQLLLGALADAKYVSLFGGRIADMGYNVVEEIKKFKAIMPQTKLILGSVRGPRNIVDWLVAGANIVTVAPNILEKALVHPRTKETVTQFLEDVKECG